MENSSSRSKQSINNEIKITYYKRKSIRKSDSYKKDAIIYDSQYAGSDLLDSSLEPNIVAKSLNSSHLSQEWHEDKPLSQSSASELHLGQKWYGEDSQRFDRTTRDVGTMTEPNATRDLDLVKQCNELFGRIVACEISNINGNDRYDKMKEILDVFQKIKL